MSRRKDGQPRGRYTLEFKMEAVGLVKGGQASAVTAKVLGMPKQTLENWIRLSEKGQLKGAGDKQCTWPEAVCFLEAPNCGGTQRDPV